MSKYQQLQTLKPDLFKRATGLKPETFNLMVDILVKAEEDKKKLGGKPNKLSIEDRLLMSLEYLREYSLAVLIHGQILRLLVPQGAKW